MKFKRLGMVLVWALAMACLASFSCVKGGTDGDGNDDSQKPNFVADTVTGSQTLYTPSAANATSITYYSYVKNIGGTGKISMTIGATGNTATAQYDVTAGTSYVFQATVTVVKQSNTTYTYSVQFPGTPGYLDTRTETGYHHTGAPQNLLLTPK
jgi:hypothetical protein